MIKLWEFNTFVFDFITNWFHHGTIWLEIVTNWFNDVTNWCNDVTIWLISRVFLTVYPLPISSNQKTGVHIICQALCSQHCKLMDLNLELSDRRDYISLGDSLVINSSLRSLTLSSKRPLNSTCFQIKFVFPILLYSR